MTPEVVRVDIDRAVVRYIENATIRATTPYHFVARAIAFQADTGARLTPGGICQYALQLSKTANVGGITFDDVHDVLPEVVKALQSPNPISRLNLGRS